MQTNEVVPKPVGNIPKSHHGCSGALPTASSQQGQNWSVKPPTGSKNCWNSATSKNPFAFHHSHLTHALNKRFPQERQENGDFLSLLHPFPGQFQTCWVGDAFTCEIHSEPGADVPHLQLQQALDVPGFGSRRGIAAVEVQQLHQLRSLAPLQQQLLLLGAGIAPAERGARGGLRGFIPLHPFPRNEQGGRDVPFQVFLPASWVTFAAPYGSKVTNSPLLQAAPRLCLGLGSFSSQQLLWGCLGSVGLIGICAD